MSALARLPSLRTALPVLQLRLLLLFLAVVLLLAPSANAAPQPAPLQLGAGVASVDAWAAVTLLDDPGGRLDAQDALAAAGRFTRPALARGALGVNAEPTWLRIPFRTAAGAPGDWVVQVDFALLDYLDFYLVEGATVRHLGSSGRRQTDAGALKGRVPAVALALQPGTQYTLLLRVAARGPRVTPVSFMRPDAFHRASLAEQMLQGLLLGIPACLLVYSIGQCLTLREPLYGKYAMFVGGLTLYSVCWFGLGEQFVWRGEPWTSKHMMGLSSLLGSAGAYLFVEQILARPGRDRGFSRMMKAGAALCGITAVAWAFDLIGHRPLMFIVGTVGSAPMLLGIPGAWRRAREGDVIGVYFLLSWVSSVGGAIIQMLLIVGKLPANFWTLHSLQLGVTFDMLMFIRMLSLRSKAIQTAMLRAEAEARMKSEFLANMSHEIRTPLNAIIGMSRLALMGEAPPRLRNYLGKILGAGEHLLALVNDILDHARMEAGKLSIESVPFALDEVLEHVDSVTSIRSDAKGIELVFRVGAGVPRQLVGDPLRLGQVLVNLAGNAVKFTERGEVVIAVEVIESGPGEGAGDSSRVTLAFSVTDTGIGMAPEQMGRLFQSFSQADSSTTRKYGGTGLGLSISHQLVELMQGTITATSTPGAGSRFTFTVPLGVGTLPQAHVAAQGPGDDRPLPMKTATAAMAALPLLDGARILLAEDNANNREVALDFMAAARMQVDVAFNGVEAVRMARSGDYDLVLMDIQMPELDGLGATREIRLDARLRALPIVAMTAHALASDRAKSLAAGMNDHVTKPIDPDLLFCTLLKWIDPARLAGRTIPPAAAPIAGPSATSLEAAGRLPSVAGLDWDQALRNVDGQRPRLEKRASSFVREYAAAPHVLREALIRGDHASLQSLAHNLKSSAAYVGAFELSAIAHRIEQDLRSDQAVRLGVQVPALVAAVETVLAGLAQVAAAALPRPAAPQALVSLAPLVARLQGYLSVDDARAADALAELEALLEGSEHAGALGQVRRAVQELEYAAAVAPLALLAAGLETGEPRMETP